MSFGQDLEKEIKYKNWYNGSAGIIGGLDENAPIGFRYAWKYIYVDFKSNFGLWATNKPKDYDRDDDIGDQAIDIILRGGSLTHRSIDESHATYNINIGLNFPLIKTQSTTFSLFGGPGLYAVNERIYEKYNQDWGGIAWATPNKVNWDFNLNYGIELAFKNSIGLLFGQDTKSKSFNVGLTFPVTRAIPKELIDEIAKKKLDKLISKTFFSKAAKSWTIDLFR